MNGYVEWTPHSSIHYSVLNLNMLMCLQHEPTIQARIRGCTIIKETTAVFSLGARFWNRMMSTTATVSVCLEFLLEVEDDDGKNTNNRCLQRTSLRTSAGNTHFRVKHWVKHFSQAVFNVLVLHKFLPVCCKTNSRMIKALHVHWSPLA